MVTNQVGVDLKISSLTFPRTEVLPSPGVCLGNLPCVAALPWGLAPAWGPRAAGPRVEGLRRVLAGWVGAWRGS